MVGGEIAPKSTPRVFVLEDSTSRIEWFEARYPGCVVAKTAEEAFEILKVHEFDLIFLDHDLDFVHYGGYSEGQPPTGADVVKFSLDHDLSPKARFVVHSMNTSAAPGMHLDLKRSGRDSVYCPFNALCQLVMG